MTRNSYPPHFLRFCIKSVTMKRIVFHGNLTAEDMREKLAKKAKANDGGGIPPALQPFLPAPAPAPPPARFQQNQNDILTSGNRKGANRRCVVVISTHFYLFRPPPSPSSSFSSSFLPLLRGSNLRISVVHVPQGPIRRGTKSPDPKTQKKRDDSRRDYVIERLQMAASSLVSDESWAPIVMAHPERAKAAFISAIASLAGASPPLSAKEKEEPASMANVLLRLPCVLPVILTLFPFF